MEENKVEVLEQSREIYQSIRNEKLATGIIIQSRKGDYEIKNTLVINNVLDFLVKEINEQIKRYNLKK